MNVGIIGARGFVGEHLINHMKSLGMVTKGYTRETLDLNDPSSLANLEDHDVVVNCVAQVAGLEDELFATNVQAVHSLCGELNRRRNKPYLLHLSSGAVYGYADKAVVEMSMEAPVGAYAITKFLGDEVMRLCYTGAWAVARLYFPYGVGQAENRLIPRLIKKVLTNQPIEISRQVECPLINPIHIDDLCEKLHSMARSKATGVHLLGGGEVISIVDIAKMIGRISGVEVKFSEVDGPTSNMFCVGSGHISLEQGLAPMIYLKRDW